MIIYILRRRSLSSSFRNNHNKKEKIERGAKLSDIKTSSSIMTQHCDSTL